MELTEIQVDYIKELFNVGLGEAASELGEMTNEEILMSVPNFKLFKKGLIYNELGIEPDKQVSCVALPIEGVLKGNGILLYPAENSLDLIRKVLKDRGSSTSLSELEVEALTEISGIILDKVITTIGELLQLDISTRMPIAINSKFETLVDKYYSGEMVMFVGMHFEFEDSPLRGDILFVQDISVIQDFLNRTNEVLSELGL